jgi:cytoskeletal protein CcmA (bactofilin family)
MFSNSKKQSSQAMQNNKPSSAINTLVSGTHAEGTIIAKSDIRIDGMVEGNLQCSGKLIIGIEGKVEGEAICQNAVIEGTFRGSLTVHDSLDVRENANVVGDIKTGKLNVQAGAIFNGNCDMGQKIKNIPSSEIQEVSAS